MRRIIVLLVSVVLLALAANVPALAAPGEHEGRSPTGKPTDPNCWGEVTSQRASDEHDIGEHASDPLPTLDFGVSGRETPRQGVGNVSRTDANPAGDHPSDHGALVGPVLGSECVEGPETS